MRQLNPGDRIGGDFKVLKVFGGIDRSGMGVVYLVETRDGHIPIVLKTFQGESDPAKTQFKKECTAWILAGAHPSIVQAHWVREIDDQLFIAAEYVAPDPSGKNTLTQYLAQGPIPIELAISWSAQFCTGMGYAHSKGLKVHRDIKPDNLMIDSSGVLKVTDFGIAKAADRPVEPGKKAWWPFGSGKAIPASAEGGTKFGQLKGTPPYMAPEQFTQGPSVDHRADIYSYGIVLFQMASGNQYPYLFSGIEPDPLMAFFKAHCHQAPVTIQSPLMPIISKCLAKNSGDRYDSYQSLLEDLKSLARRLNMAVYLPTKVQQEDEELYARAQSYVALGKPEEALKHINLYTAKYPDAACGWTEKGKIHLERQELSASVNATNRSLALDPFNTHAWNNLAIGLHQSKAPIQDVKAAYKKALYFDPGNTPAIANYAGALARESEWDEAAFWGAMGIMADPGYPRMNDLVNVLFKELMDHKQFPAVQTLLEGWRKAKPENLDVWNNLGIVYGMLGRHKDAFSCFSHLHKHQPHESFPLIQATKEAFLAAEYQHCIAHARLLLERRIEPLLAVTLTARSLSKLNGLQEAMTFFEPYLRNSPTNDGLWVVAAEMFEDHGRIQDAFESIQRAWAIVSHAPEHPGDGEKFRFLKEQLNRLNQKRTP